MAENIVIDIDNLRARKILKNQNNHFFIKQYSEQIHHLINRRVRELNGQNMGKAEDYFQYKMHDSILIYGTRGNGKTTIMMNLKEMLDTQLPKDEKNFKIMEIIDPTLLEEEEDFLLVILKNVYAEILKYETGNFNNYNKRFEQQLEHILEQIEGTRVKLDNKIEIFDKFYGNKSGVSLVKTIHELFHTATQIFNVNVIILPLDDIDMNMVQGYRITETIRKYLSSPYIIPIVSFNLKQMNAIAKKNKYEAFGLSLLNRENESHMDLDFLRSLPSDYLASIFPPNRRIFLKSLFYILSEELKEKEIFLESHKLEELPKQEKNSSNQINLITILRLFLELVYEKRLPKNFEAKHLNIINDYLTCRSIRDFFNDMTATIHSLTTHEENEEKYLTSKQSNLLTRFSPENQNIFSSKEQALISLWHDFLEIAKKNLNKKDLSNQEIQNNWADVITDVAYDDYAELVHKKTYRRLWLQRYYTDLNPKIDTDKKQLQETSKEKFYFTVNKKSSLAGFLELCLRSYIPMFLFEMIISRHTNTYSMYDIMKLRNMATSSLIDVAYYLSIMELHLKQFDSDEKTLRKEAKIFASIHVNAHHEKLYEPEFNIPYLFKLRKQDLFFSTNDKDSRQMYFFSIFKGIALFIESLRLSERYEDDKELDNAYRTLFERYRINLPCEHQNDFIKNYHGKLMESYKEQLKNIQDFHLEDSEFGIQTCMAFSKRLINFFYEIRSNINLDDEFSSLNFCKNNLKTLKIKAEGSLSPYFDFPLSTYLSGFSQALLISLIQTQEDAKDFNIYTINSIHGANLLLLKKFPSKEFPNQEEYQLSKASNKFLSNIHYLLPKDNQSSTNDYSVLNEIADGKYDNKKEGSPSNNLNNILKLFDSFLGIDYFLTLMKNYQNKEASENCDERKANERKRKRQNAS
jgi:hypothetical protein